MKFKILTLLLLTPFLHLGAQEATSAYNVLRLPTSSHVAALGGVNNSLIDDVPTAGWNNPALYTNVSNNSLGLNFMTYASGSKWMGAQYVRALGERHTLAVHGQMMNYGSVDETDEQGHVTGTCKANDFTIGAGYSYLLSDRWTGGANVKMLVSSLAGYTAMALAVDVGVNFYDADRDLSISASMQQVGVQLKAYESGKRAHLPFELNLGMSKGLDHLPIRFHITLQDITRWNTKYYALPDDDSKKPSFTRLALNHLVLGLDILPTHNTYIAVGYNFRRAYELKASGSGHMAGLTAGAGIAVKRFKFGLSYARYHQANHSLMGTAAYSL